MDLSKTIVTDSNGVIAECSLESLQVYLQDIAEVSLDSEDFVRKVDYGLTDETKLTKADKETLEDWYYQNYLIL